MKNLLWVAKHGRTKTVESLLKAEDCTPKGINEALIASANITQFDVNEGIQLLLDTGRYSKGVIKKALFDENGELKSEFNTKKMTNAIIKNYYLNKKTLEKLNFTEEAAKELSEKYQAQEEWSIEKYQKDLIIIHNIDTLLDRNILVGKDIMKLLAKMTQHHFVRITK
ncbi:MAG: hypothetical protein AB8B46_00785 [Candidatus Midichloriaceae bacterium]